MGQGGQDGQADGQEVKIHRDSGGSGVFHQDGDIHLRDQATQHGAEQDKQGRGDRVGDGNH